MRNQFLVLLVVGVFPDMPLFWSKKTLGYLLWCSIRLLPVFVKIPDKIGDQPDLFRGVSLQGQVVILLHAQQVICRHMKKPAQSDNILGGGGGQTAFPRIDGTAGHIQPFCQFRLRHAGGLPQLPNPHTDHTNTSCISYHAGQDNKLSKSV